MAVTEYDIIRDEQERSNLLSAIADVETAIAVSTPGTRRILENTRDNAVKRVAVLEKRIEEAKTEHAAEVQAQATAAAALAAKETRLSEKEKETYRGFLEESYFTKKDFGKLDGFYKHSYDRLSENGKEELSKRIHEGIRRGEFKFADLPQTIQEKDNAHCAGKAGKDAPAQAHVSNRKDTVNHSTTSTETSAVKSIDLTSVDVSGMKSADMTASSSASSLPDVSGSKVAQR